MPEWREDLRAHLARLRVRPAREAEIIEGDVELAARVMQMSGSRRPAELPAGPPPEQTLRAVAKRAVIRVNPVRVYSWDHRKLGGAY